MSGRKFISKLALSLLNLRGKAVTRHPAIVVNFHAGLSDDPDQMSASEHLKIFALFPRGDFRLKALDLGVLYKDVVVDEFFSHRRAKERIVLESKDGFPQGGRQKTGLGLIWRIGDAPGSSDRSRPDRICDAI